MAKPPASSSKADFIRAVDHVIKERKTAKILRDPTECDALTELQQIELRQQLEAIIELAGWAPFHKVANVIHREGAQTSIVPWRFYVMEKPVCCNFLRYIDQQAQANPESKWSYAWASKVPSLLAGAGAVILVTWLPDPHPDLETPPMTTQNVEHIAAASAATQNLLLAAEARGLFTYWATGGILREPEAYERLAIPKNQAFLGAIYLTSADIEYTENQSGKLRHKRGETSSWVHWL